MRSFRPALAAALLLALPAVAGAQYGGTYNSGRPMGSRTGGMPNPEPMERKADAGPSSEELVDLKPYLRGLKLQPAQDTAIRGVRERYEPQLLPLYDWLRDQSVRKQKGQDVDKDLVQRKFDRIAVLKKKELDEIRPLLSADQLTRFEKNVLDEREAEAADIARSDRRRPPTP
jgi:hypothetical protein